MKSMMRLHEDHWPPVRKIYDSERGSELERNESGAFRSQKLTVFANFNSDNFAKSEHSENWKTRPP